MEAKIKKEGILSGSNVPPEILAEEAFFEPGVPNSVKPEKINFHLAPREYVLQCPYDKNHQILPYRMERHLIRCRKNHGKAQGLMGATTRFRVCPHNDAHIIRDKELCFHALQCSSRYDVPDKKQDFLKFIPTLDPHQELEQEVNEDWENDVVEVDRKGSAPSFLDYLQEKLPKKVEKLCLRRKNPFLNPEA